MFYRNAEEKMYDVLWRALLNRSRQRRIECQMAPGSGKEFVYIDNIFIKSVFKKSQVIYAKIDKYIDKCIDK